MAKNKKRKKSSGGGFGKSSGQWDRALPGLADDVPFKNPPEMEAAWLAQFTPVSEDTLTPKQAEFLAKKKNQFPGLKVGTRAGRLDYYVIDNAMGPIAGHMP